MAIGRTGPSGPHRRGAVLLSLAVFSAQRSASGKKVADGAPGVLDCTWSPAWSEFRDTFRANAEQGFPHSEEVFNQADRLIAQNILTFLEFHRSKSNAFFHGCDRETREDMVCLYGMLSALFVHHIYLRSNLEASAGSASAADHASADAAMADDQEVFRLSTNLARLLVINKNNCLDFFDSSHWPLSVAQLVTTLRPEELEDLPLPPSRHWAVWQMPSVPSLPGTSSPRLLCYITGTHAALAREPAEMLWRFGPPLLGLPVASVMEVADDTHCGFLGCDTTHAHATPLLPSVGLEGEGFHPVGLRQLAEEHFQPRWTALDIVDFPGLLRDFQERLRQHALSRAMDITICTSPAVLCLLLFPFKKPLLGYFGEPLLLSVEASVRQQWFQQFHQMATDPQSFFACYNPFLSSMIEYQTGLQLPTIRLHGLYTQVRHRDVWADATRGKQLLVLKGPNICLDSVCLLNRFSENLSSKHQFVGLDELGGAPYETLASFRAAVLYPYDVALAIFYELYTMSMPLLLPSERLLSFYVFRGLHSNAEYHFVWDEHQASASAWMAPFVPAMEPSKWFARAAPWSLRTDFAQFPHLLRFSSVAELFERLESSDWAEVSRQMSRFNEETLAQSAAWWAYATAKVLARNFGMSEEKDAMLIVYGGALWALANYLVLPLVKLLGIGLGFSLYHFVNLVVGYGIGRFGIFNMEKLTGNVEICDIGCCLVLVSFVIMVFVEEAGDKQQDLSDRQGLAESTQDELTEGGRSEQQSNQDFREKYTRWREDHVAPARRHSVIEAAGTVLVSYSTGETGGQLKSVGGFSVAQPPRLVAHRPEEPSSEAMPSDLEAAGDLEAPSPGAASRASRGEAVQSFLQVAEASAEPNTAAGRVGRKAVGVLLALLAGTLTGVQSVPASLYNQRHKGQAATDVVFPQCLGIYICSSAIYLLYAAVAKLSGWRVPHAPIRPAYLSGCIWAVGFTFMITGISSLGFSIGYTLGARRARRYTLRGQESDS
ncbi:Transmembrane protein 144 homolog A (Transmembrane protein 144 homolog 1), partial [Durusdinium trenchii]